MEGVIGEFSDLILLKRILFTMVGLLSCFFGLLVYKSTIKVVGFVVGMVGGGYVVLIFFSQAAIISNLSNINFLIVVILVLILGGVLGMYLAKMFQFVIFFLAGGIIALILARLWAGDVAIGDFSNFETLREALTDASPKIWEIVVFFVGGLLYMINIGPIVALTTAALGAFLLRWTWLDYLQDVGPQIGDISALVLVVVGASIQLAAFRGRMDVIPARFRK